MSNVLENFINNIFTYFSPPLDVPQYIYEMDILIYFGIFLTGAVIIFSSYKKLNSANVKLLRTDYGAAIILTNLGITLVIFNLLISEIVFFFSKGASTIFYEQKGMFATIGYTLYSVSLPYAINEIVQTSKSVKKILNRAFFVFIILATGITILVILSLAQIINFPLTIILSLGVFLLLVNIVSIIILIREYFVTYNKPDTVRIIFLTLGILVFTLDIFFNFLDFALSFPQYLPLLNGIGNNVSTIINNIYFIILPLERIITYACGMGFFYVCYFFPIWLQDRLHLLPPSFSELLRKRDKRQSKNRSSTS